VTVTTQVPSAATEPLQLLVSVYGDEAPRESAAVKV